MNLKERQKAFRDRWNYHPQESDSDNLEKFNTFFKEWIYHYNSIILNRRQIKILYNIETQTIMIRKSTRSGRTRELDISIPKYYESREFSEIELFEFIEMLLNVELVDDNLRSINLFEIIQAAEICELKVKFIRKKMK